MIGSQTRDQLEFFVCGSLRDLVPDDHILARVVSFCTLAGCARRLPIFTPQALAVPGSIRRRRSA